jgi:hypothetical protein
MLNLFAARQLIKNVSSLILFCGAVVGMRIGRENRSTRRKPVPVPLCPPHNPT